MKTRIKIILGLLLIPIFLIGGAYILMDYLSRQALSGSNDQPEEVPYSLPQEFSSENHPLDEGFAFQLVDGWQLTDKTPDRNVDRYRFEKPEDKAVFTISFYDDFDSFDKVIQNRYGSGHIINQEEATVNEMPAKRITSAFVGDRSTLDVIIQTGENQYVSLYGLHSPEGEGAISVIQQIDYMQQSFTRDANIRMHTNDTSG